MCRFWLQRRKRVEHWKRQFLLHMVALVLCVAILTFTVAQKFSEGAWVTLLVTTALVVLCLCIELHYRHVASNCGGSTKNWATSACSKAKVACPTPSCQPRC